MPWVGIRYVQAIEDVLQQLILDNLNTYTQSVADKLGSNTVAIPSFPPGDTIYAVPLVKQPIMDGYDADWNDYFSQKLQLSEVNNNKASSPQMLIARHGQYAYLYVWVPDNQIRYFNDDLPLLGSAAADSVILDLVKQDGIHNLALVSEAPGSFYARDIKTGKRDLRIQAVWRERDDGAGYQIELRLPLSYVNRGLNVSVLNNAEGQSQRFQLHKVPLPVMSAPESLRDEMQGFSLVEGRRIWLLDSEGRVLVNQGSIYIDQNLSPVNPLFAWLLAPEIVSDPWRGKTRFERDDIQQALSGQHATSRISIQDGKHMMLSSAWPVMRNEQIVAAILIEESTAAVQLMQRSALSDLLNLSLVIFIILTAALIGFAGRLSNRIRRLKKATDRAIDDQGRVQGHIPEKQKGDELADLSNHIRAMLKRLQAYHDYLEKLASRLSHEIRTPLAVVKSSLENVQFESDIEDGQNAQSLARANEGVQRLQTLLLRMSEASRLEQSIQESEFAEFEMDEFLKAVVQGYRDVYPGHVFELNVDTGLISASKDLLAQALDKLIANAVSFAPEKSTIHISASMDVNWQLSVQNSGPHLPEDMQEQVFQSMVSVRDKAHKGKQPHLGLGLHIVQLIADYHQGEVKAGNTEDGVQFTMLIPS